MTALKTEHELMESGCKQYERPCPKVGRSGQKLETLLQRRMKCYMNGMKLR